MDETLLTALLIVLARITDVSIGTFRTVSLVRGRRVLATCLGFFESLIWVLVVAKVATSLHEPLYMIAYALGFSLGNFIGLSLEHRIAMGQQVLRVVTRRGGEMADALRAQGLRVTSFEGNGRDGAVSMLLVKSARRSMTRILDEAKRIDERCFYFIDDIAEGVRERKMIFPFFRPTGWRSRSKAK